MGQCIKGKKPVLQNTKDQYQNACISISVRVYAHTHTHIYEHMPCINGD